MSDRGMKKWAPYASLIEQKGTLGAMMHNRRKVARPHISSDQAAFIERCLVDYHGETLTITYFDDGFIRSCRDIILTIDQLNRCIICANATIAYKDLLALEE